MKSPQESIFSSKTLTYFLQLADTMNYTQAAQLLGITQPALTQQIKKLERTVGAPLFYSIGKKLHLSEAGVTMLEATQQIYEVLNVATDRIQEASDASNGKINIGLLASIEDAAFNSFIADYYEHNPQVQVTLRMMTGMRFGTSWKTTKSIWPSCTYPMKPSSTGIHTRPRKLSMNRWFSCITMKKCRTASA